jgi:hypothetical protein
MGDSDILEIVKEEASKFGFSPDSATADAILWERTGFPSAWKIPQDGHDPETCCRTELKRFFRRMREFGLPLSERPEPFTGAW